MSHFNFPSNLYSVYEQGFTDGASATKAHMMEIVDSIEEAVNEMVAEHENELQLAYQTGFDDGKGAETPFFEELEETFYDCIRRGLAKEDEHSSADYFRDKRMTIEEMKAGYERQIEELNKMNDEEFDRGYKLGLIKMAEKFADLKYECDNISNMINDIN